MMIAGLLVAPLVFSHDATDYPWVVVLSAAAVLANGVNGLKSSLKPNSVSNFERVLFGLIAGLGLGAFISSL